MAEIERLLPRPSTEVSVLLPYARGDLLARAHREGEIISVEHTDAGTALTARVQAGAGGANSTASSSPRGRLKVPARQWSEFAGRTGLASIGSAVDAVRTALRKFVR